MDNLQNLFKKNHVVIDANNIFFATYSVSTYTFNDEFYGAVLGFLNLITKTMKSYSPESIYIVWDGVGSRKKRQAINENYKANRNIPTPYQLNKLDDSVSHEDREKNRTLQKELLLSIFSTLPFYNICIENLEADDIISILSRKIGRNNDNVIIVSNDKDFFQLLNDNVSIYRPVDKSLFTKQDLLERDGIFPNNYALARALEGDKSDNLPGVGSAGLKTILKRIEDFSKEKKISIEYLFDTCSVLNQKKRYKILENIINSKELVESNYEIMQLYEINLTPEQNEELRSIIDHSNQFKEQDFDELCKQFVNPSMMKSFKMHVKKFNDIQYF
jgi:DNA polymerase-1